MKDAEDEAFDELAKRQGDWGGGFSAKRKMAADKINFEFDEEYKKMHKDWVKYGTSWSKDGERIDPMSVYKKQPALGYCKNCKDYTIEEPLYAQPAQEPVADRLERLLWEYIDLQAAHPEHKPNPKT